MKNVKRLTLVSVLLFVGSAFSDVAIKNDPNAITAIEVKQAIGLLIRAGVLGIENSELVVREPTILDQLDQQGRVDDGKTHPSAICSK